MGKKVRDGLFGLANPAKKEVIAWLFDDVVWALTQESAFGKAVADGYLRLLTALNGWVPPEYRRLIRKAGANGPTLGKLMAIHLVPVLTCSNTRMPELFLDTLEVMLRKGNYTLPLPLEALTRILDGGDCRSAEIFLEILTAVFSEDLSYSRCQHFSLVLPRTALRLDASKRPWQLAQLLRVARENHRLLDAVLTGMDKGLLLLSEQALRRFIHRGLLKSRKGLQLGEKFLSLDSKQGADAFSELQVAVSLNQLRQGLNRYLKARTGLPLTVRPLSETPGSLRENFIGSCSDGAYIYLPDEIDIFEHKADNLKLYKCLVRLESGYYEFGSFDFDLERLRESCRHRKDLKRDLPQPRQPEGVSDHEQFFGKFSRPDLAADLFIVFEHGRLRRRFNRSYPGLVREYLPVIRKEALRMLSSSERTGFVFALYSAIALDMRLPEKKAQSPRANGILDRALHTFEDRMAAWDEAAECAAQLVLELYDDLECHLLRTESDPGTGLDYIALRIPFNRRFRPDLVFAADFQNEQAARLLQKHLEEIGIRVYASAIRKYLNQNRGTLKTDELEKILQTESEPEGVMEEVPPQTLAGIIGHLPGELKQIVVQAGAENGPEFDAACRYKEWDCHLGDYLQDHTRVRDCRPEGRRNGFYGQTLERRSGLIKGMRTAFELLKPQGIKLYRKWVEGDEFELRALIDFVLDRKAGRTPSDRLYLKRVKEMRDVAVLLLVDLSRSTSNRVADSQATVLDVEKEAIVLFSEALEVVGDAYAIAGFSGTGRLGVDYFHIKDFEEPLDDSIRQRINAMFPQRNTRMGAAIRHAAEQLEAVSSVVRLLVILGDGFPNDLEYRQRYAVEDTRKAVSELRAKGIHVHAITVNLGLKTGEASNLDTLYGRIHHNLITDVAQLPDKLWRIYGTLTGQ